MLERTKKFALRIIRLASKLPKSDVARVVGGQVLRSGTSISANYREASRCATRKHFASTMTIALKEADETLYWLELLAESETVKPAPLTELLVECNELVAILTASVRTAKQ
ncbi:MAG: four helix bundle protein [Pirellulales bacterium]|nr:four helix bundle protein [Pirellulales bacterium]